MAKSQKPKSKAAKSKSAAKLFTIGYEKAKPDAVMAELKRAKVKLLVDTRAVAASRIAVIGRQKLQYALSFQQPIAPSAAARSVIANSRALSTMSRPWSIASERWTRFQMAAPLSCQKIDAAV